MPRNLDEQPTDAMVVRITDRDPTRGNLYTMLRTRRTWFRSRGFRDHVVPVTFWCTNKRCPPGKRSTDGQWDAMIVVVPQNFRDLASSAKRRVSVSEYRGIVQSAMDQ